MLPIARAMVWPCKSHRQRDAPCAEQGHIPSTSRADSRVLIEVHDDGCGISTAKLAGLRGACEPGLFAHRWGGLGLAIVSKIGRSRRYADR